MKNKSKKKKSMVKKDKKVTERNYKNGYPEYELWPSLRPPIKGL